MNLDISLVLLKKGIKIYKILIWQPNTQIILEILKYYLH